MELCQNKTTPKTSIRTRENKIFFTRCSHNLSLILLSYHFFIRYCKTHFDKQQVTSVEDQNLEKKSTLEDFSGNQEEGGNDRLNKKPEDVTGKIGSVHPKIVVLENDQNSIKDLLTEKNRIKNEEKEEETVDQSQTEDTATQKKNGVSGCLKR